MTMMTPLSDFDAASSLNVHIAVKRNICDLKA